MWRIYASLGKWGLFFMTHICDTRPRWVKPWRLIFASVNCLVWVMSCRLLGTKSLPEPNIKPHQNGMKSPESHLLHNLGHKHDENRIRWIGSYGENGYRIFNSLACHLNPSGAETGIFTDNWSISRLLMLWFQRHHAISNQAYWLYKTSVSFIVFNENRFQLHVLSRCWGIIKDASISMA